MALATKCPHCSTIFRVAADQLKLRGGIVRCGSCALVFDGNAALVEPAPKPTPVIPDVAAETPPAKPAVSDYVHGSPVDFEIDFDDAQAEVAPPAATPSEAHPEPASPAPAVWRSASAPAPVAEPETAAPQSEAKKPTPDDIAIAAVSRAFAAATTHAAPASAAPAAEASRATAPLQAAAAPRAAELQPAPAPAAAQPAVRTPSSPAGRSLIDVVSPDAAFTAAAEPSPPLVPDTAAAPSPVRAKSHAGPSSLADLVAPDAIFDATAEPSPPLAPPTPTNATYPVGSAVLSDMLAPDATFSATTETAPVAAAPATPAPPPIPAAPAIEEASPADDAVPPYRDETPTEHGHAVDGSTPPPEAALAFEAPLPVEHAVAPADGEVLPYSDEASFEAVQAAEESTLAPEAVLAFEAPSSAGQAASPAEEELPPQLDEQSSEPAPGAEESTLPPVEHAVLPADEEVPQDQDETSTEPEQGAEESTPPQEESLALDPPSPAEHAASPADEDAPLHLDETSTEPAPAPSEPVEPAGASLVDAIDQWSADNTHPDGRVEPSLDTPQEHLVAATLDDAHHFEDLPSDEQPEPAAPASAEADSASEPSLAAEPWSSIDATADTPAPGSEPWSLSEPDETALHAVAAVNTDAPDDGASVTEEAPVEAPAKSRRERALKRARSRRDASGPAAEHEVFAIEENGPEQEISAEEIAARMRAIAGVDEKGEAEDLDHSDLSFVKRVDRSQRYGKAATITMAVGVPILLAGLVLQAATTFRDTLAANYPQLKPALTAVCQPLGCKIALPTQLDALSVEPGELASMTENTFSFSTVLRNQSKTPQAWPHVELTLNDNADKPVLRRVFAPHEYLPSPNEADKGFGPRSEQSIKLYFELKELKASGYHIAIFYP